MLAREMDDKCLAEVAAAERLQTNADTLGLPGVKAAVSSSNTHVVKAASRFNYPKQPSSARVSGCSTSGFVSIQKIQLLRVRHCYDRYSVLMCSTTWEEADNPEFLMAVKVVCYDVL